MVHAFEASGLGKAPFTYHGTEHRVGPIKQLDANGNPTGVEFGAPGQPMGTCDHCGLGIAYLCHIKSADGKRSVVGTTCIEKLFEDSNPDLVLEAQKGHSEARKAKDRAARARKRDVARKAAVEARKLQTRAKMRESLRADPTLRELLALEHTIAQDIRKTFIGWGYLTEKQTAVLRNLMAEHKAKDEMVFVEGRRTFDAQVLLTRAYDGIYGIDHKMLVLGRVDEGTIKVWCTLPRSIMSAETLIGRRIQLTVTLTPARVKGEGCHSGKRPVAKLYGTA